MVAGTVGGSGIERIKGTDKEGLLDVNRIDRCGDANHTIGNDHERIVELALSFPPTRGCDSVQHAHTGWYAGARNAYLCMR